MASSGMADKWCALAGNAAMGSRNAATFSHLACSELLWNCHWLVVVAHVGSTTRRNIELHDCGVNND
jgi:hypothetical protein